MMTEIRELINCRAVVVTADSQGSLKLQSSGLSPLERHINGISGAKPGNNRIDLAPVVLEYDLR